MTYLYRFDTLKGLRAQSSDPVLRAKRIIKASGSFDHHQVLAELATADFVAGVYRFCFWRHWQAALKNFHATSPGSTWIMQRVRSNHPALAKFNKDDDEYLVSEAWIYWQSNYIDATRPDWSPDEISHNDVEVLTPVGIWERLSTSTLMRDSSFDSWQCLPLRGINGPSPIFSRSLVRSIGDENQVWVLIRQPIGQWTTAWQDSDLLAEAASLMLSNLRGIGLEYVHWVVSLECNDRVLSAEFHPRFYAPELGFFERNSVPRRCHGIEDVEVVVDDQFRLLDELTQQLLYVDFGIAEVLLLHRRYEYLPHVLQTD